MNTPSFEELFKTIKLNFWIVGIPYGDFKFKLRYFFLLACICVMLLVEFLYLVSKASTDNFLELAQLAPCFCNGLLATLKFVAVSMNRQKIYQLTEKLKPLYTEIKRDVEKSSLIRADFVFLKFLIKYFNILNWVLICVYNFSTPIIILTNYLIHNEVSYALPFAVLLPFEVNDWISWSVVYFPSISCGFICTWYAVTADTLYYILTSHICGNFTVLYNKFKKLNAANAGSLLQEIVQDHQNILKLADDVEDIFTAPNLFNVLVGSLEICALGFNLTTGDLKKMPGCILFLVSVLLQILMMSIFGENIITESTNIGEAAYKSKWFEMDKKSKKMILIILTRSAKPQVFTAYNFSVIGYASFAKIISTSWSYFTILKTVYVPPAENE